MPSQGAYKNQPLSAWISGTTIRSLLSFIKSVKVLKFFPQAKLLHFQALVGLHTLSRTECNSYSTTRPMELLWAKECPQFLLCLLIYNLGFPPQTRVLGACGFGGYSMFSIHCEALSPGTPEGFLWGFPHMFCYCPIHVPSRCLYVDVTVDLRVCHSRPSCLFLLTVALFYLIDNCLPLVG